MKRIILFFIIIFCINSCYDIAYVGIAGKYNGIYKSRQKIFGSGYDKYLYVRVESGGIIIYFAPDGYYEDVSDDPNYEYIEYNNFLGDGNVYNFSNNDSVGKLVFRSDSQVEVTIKGEGVFNINNVICDLYIKL